MNWIGNPNGAPALISLVLSSFSATFPSHPACLHHLPRHSQSRNLYHHKAHAILLPNFQTGQHSSPFSSIDSPDYMLLPVRAIIIYIIYRISLRPPHTNPGRLQSFSASPVPSNRSRPTRDHPRAATIPGMTSGRLRCDTCYEAHVSVILF